MNWDHESKFILITGKRGTGKTSLFIQYWKKSKARYKFAFDPDQEIARKCKVKPALSIVECVHFLKHHYPVVYDPSQEFPGNFDEAFSLWIRWVYEVSRVLDGVKELFIDEVQKRTRTGVGGCPLPLIEICDTGRREEIDCVFVVNKGLNKLSDDIRSQLTVIHAFKTTERTSLDWLEEEGFDPEQISELQKGQYITKEL